MDEKSAKAALELAVRLLAGRAHSRHEVEAKLRKKGFDPESITKALEKLDQLKLIDDHTFADSFLTSIARRRPEGHFKTRARLKLKGLSDEIINETLASSDQSALCVAAAEKKLRTLSGPPELKKRKLITFLINRGFSWETIARVLGDFFPRSD